MVGKTAHLAADLITAAHGNNLPRRRTSRARIRQDTDVAGEARAAATGREPLRMMPAAEYLFPVLALGLSAAWRPMMPAKPVGGSIHWGPTSFASVRSHSQEGM